ncbi:hypothetical protein [Halobacterium sp. R2-5]|uniref:hypothetical protein n=1 Tax=Halobacterium sp. R2-5 TaxID=2715751 RepID=UPI00141E6817|nr:hypothetical protein [Halobacterium sp. R2-5]NIB98753.1 hypothetical protein [Halobacterium sp. R2-5]
MPKHLFSECPACGWDPRCAYLSDDREFSNEEVHERVVEHVRLTDDVFHNRVEGGAQLA